MLKLAKWGLGGGRRCDLGCGGWCDVRDGRRTQSALWAYGPSALNLVAFCASWFCVMTHIHPTCEK